MSDPAQATSKYTDEEWAAQINDVVNKVQATEKNYPVPQAGSRDYAKFIDHTLLKLDATPAQIDELCAEAKREDFKSVCVRLPYVKRCVENLKGSDVVVACVVGFHEGTYTTQEKLDEAKEAVAAGAAELDAVINHPSLLKGSFASIYAELASLRALCPAPTVIKLIFETSQLKPADIVAAAVLSAAAQLDFIKTSTGFCGGGATEPDVRLMRGAAEYLSTLTSINPTGKLMEVKASGGVRGLEAMDKMLKAGATRIGTSSGLVIMQEAKDPQKVAGASTEGGY